MKTIDYQRIKTNLTHETQGIINFLKKHWDIKASPKDLSVMVEMTIQDGFNRGLLAQEEAYKERHETSKFLAANLTFLSTADPSYEVFSRFHREWDVSAQPKGYDKYKEKYDQHLKPKSIIHKFGGVTKFPVGIGPDFDFPTSLSLEKVAYNEIGQGNSPSTSMQDAIFLQGKAHGRWAVWRKYEKLFNDVYMHKTRISKSKRKNQQ